MYIKVNNWQEALKAIRHFCSNDSWQRVVEQLRPEEQADLLETEISRDSWISYDSYMHLLLLVDKEAGVGDLELVKKIAVIRAKQQLNWINTLLFKLMDPRIFIMQSNQVTKKMLKPGYVFAELVSKNHIRTTFKEVDSFPEHHEVEIMTSMQVFHEMVGGQNVNIKHSACMLQGASECVFDITFE